MASALTRRACQYVDFRGNRVGSVDQRPWRSRVSASECRCSSALTITSDDVVWYTDFPRGMLGRFDPKTGQVKE